jgi:hypothetical protein
MIDQFLYHNKVLYSNSCSFGAAGQQHAVYSDHVAKNLDARLINQGKSGSCNRRILRTSLRDLIEIKKQHTNVTALIGLSFISRTELWQPWLPANDNDGHFSSIKVNDKKTNWSNQGLIDTVVPNIYESVDHRIKDYYKQWLIHFNPESELTNLLTDLIMFSSWAKLNKIQYKIFSNVDKLPSEDKVGYNSPFVSSLRHCVESDPDIIDLWNFSFGGYALELGLKPRDFNVYGIHGHPGGLAHEKFAEFLVGHLGTNNDLL